MSKTDLEIQYEQIQEKIDSLPKGYLSKKKINGKERIYRQWNENGKNIVNMCQMKKYHWFQKK